MPRRASHDELHSRFVTFSCYRRLLLDHDLAKRVVLGVLNPQLTGRKASCLGIVAMPDHVMPSCGFRSPVN